MPPKKHVNIGSRKKKSRAARFLEFEQKRARKLQQSQSESVASTSAFEPELIAQSEHGSEACIDEPGTSISTFQTERITPSEQEIEAAVDEPGFSTSVFKQELKASSEHGAEAPSDEPGSSIYNFQPELIDVSKQEIEAAVDEPGFSTSAFEQELKAASEHGAEAPSDEPGCDYFFMEKLFTKLHTCKLPEKWQVIRMANDVAIIQVTTTDSGCPVIEKSIVVYRTGNMKVYIHNQLLNMNETWMKDIPKIEMSQYIENTLAILERTVQSLNSTNVCSGNLEDECISYYKEKVRHKEAADRSSYIEWLSFKDVASDGTNYSSSVRATNCIFALKKFMRCQNCSKLRKSMNLSKFRKQLANPHDSPVSATSHTSFSSLSSGQKTQRLQNLSISLKMEKQTNERLKQKIASIISKTNVNVTDTFDYDLKGLMAATRLKDKTNFTPSQELLWKQQLQATNVKKNVGMRWDPSIIRWCLSIYCKSPSAYDTLKESGFVVLPSIRTLFGKRQLELLDQEPLPRRKSKKTEDLLEKSLD